MIGLALALFLVAQAEGMPWLERTDGQGDQIIIGGGACIIGAVTAYWKHDLLIRLGPGEDYPHGCSKERR